MRKKSKRVDFSVVLDVVLHVDATKTFTVANIASYNDAGELIEGVGVAKRSPKDKYDSKVGSGTAIKRALEDLASRFSEY